MEMILLGSGLIFLIVSFVEVIDEKNEFLFAKTYSFDKYDYVSASIAGLFVFVMFYGTVFIIVPYVDSLPELSNVLDYKEKRALTWFTIYEDYFK